VRSARSTGHGADDRGSIAQRALELDFQDAVGVVGREVAAALEDLEGILVVDQPQRLGPACPSNGGVVGDILPGGVKGGLPLEIIAMPFSPQGRGEFSRGGPSL